MGLDLLSDITSILPNGGGILGGLLGDTGSVASSAGGGGLLNLTGSGTTATKSLASTVLTSPAFWLAAALVVVVLVK